MAKPVIFTQFERPPKVLLACTEAEGKTRQSEKDSCDINKIIAQFNKTGLLPQTNRQALYMDVTGVKDYREALEQVEIAETMFRQLPAQVRARFENDPALFLDFTADPANRDEMVEMGLIEKAEAAAPPGSGGAAAPPPAQ